VRLLALRVGDHSEPVLEEALQKLPTPESRFRPESPALEREAIVTAARR
jgi:hypothetical protein